jgi:hypothetical protein
MSYLAALTTTKTPNPVEKPIKEECKPNFTECDPNIITGREIEDFFELKKGNFVMDMYYELIEDCNRLETGILKNPSFFAYNDFMELIKDQVDVSAYYKKEQNI